MLLSGLQEVLEVHEQVKASVADQLPKELIEESTGSVPQQKKSVVQDEATSQHFVQSQKIDHESQSSSVTEHSIPEQKWQQSGTAVEHFVEALTDLESKSQDELIALKEEAAQAYAHVRLEKFALAQSIRENKLQATAEQKIEARRILDQHYFYRDSRQRIQKALDQKIIEQSAPVAAVEPVILQAAPIASSALKSQQNLFVPDLEAQKRGVASDTSIVIRQFPHSILQSEKPAWLKTWVPIPEFAAGMLASTGNTRQGEILSALWGQVYEIKQFINSNPKIPRVQNLLGDSCFTRAMDPAAQKFYERLVRYEVILKTFEHATKGLTLDVGYAHQIPTLQSEVQYYTKQLETMTDKVTQHLHIELMPLGQMAHMMEAETGPKPQDAMTRFVKFYFTSLIAGQISPFTQLEFNGAWGASQGPEFTFKAGSTEWKFASQASDPVALCAAQHAKLKTQGEVSEAIAQPAPSATTVQEQEQAALAATKRQEIIRDAARLLAQHKLNPDQKQVQAAASHIMLASPVELGIQVTDKALDLTQSGPQGSYVVDPASFQEVQQNLASAATFFTEQARKQTTAGNTAFAQELLEHARYATECLKTFSDCLSEKFSEKVSSLVMNGPLMKVLQDRINPTRSATKQPIVALTEPKYNGIVQEWCAQAGDFGADVLLAILSHKAGTSLGQPPTGMAPQFAAVGVDGAIVTVAVADGAVAAAQATKAAIVLMAAGHGPEHGGDGASSDVTHDQKPTRVPSHKEPEAAQQKTEEASDKITPAARATDAEKVPAKESLPLDRRQWTQEQIDADAARKVQGRAINERGQAFEDQLQKQFGGRGRFTAKSPTESREFDGAVGNIWYEAKSGEFWNKLLESPKKLDDFKADMGRGLKVANANGASYEMYSNTPIPQIIKEWLTRKGIKYTEWP